MQRLLSALVLCLSFCCAPVAKEAPPPQTPTSPSEAPRDAGARFAAPPNEGAGDVSEYEHGAPPAEPPHASAQPWAQDKLDTLPTPAAPSKKSAANSDESAVGSSRGMGGAVAERMRPKADDRPGLGTSWGETRSSSVNEVPFERDSARPTYTGALHYNDRHGADAMAQNEGYGPQPTGASITLGGALTLSVRNEWGSALSAYRTPSRTIAIGEHGQRYTLVVQNNTNERFEVVLSVDGLDVLDGHDAGYGKRGYLIEGYATVEIEGFRQSADAVAAFRFGTVGNSYAARTGSARNVGVIGAAAFGERGYLSRLRAYQDRVYAQRTSSGEIERRRNADPFPNKWASPPLQLAH